MLFWQSPTLKLEKINFKVGNSKIKEFYTPWY